MDELQKLQMMFGNEIEVALKTFIVKAEEKGQNLQLANIACVEELLRRLVRMMSIMKVHNEKLGDEISAQGIAWLESYFAEDIWKDVDEDIESVLDDAPILKS